MLLCVHSLCWLLTLWWGKKPPVENAQWHCFSPEIIFFVSLWKELSQSLSTTCKTYPENNIRDTLLLLLLPPLFPSKANPTIRGRNEQKFLLKCHPDDWPLIQPIRINKHPSPLTCEREWASCNILKTTIVFTTLITLSPYSQCLYSSYGMIFSFSPKIFYFNT